MSARGHFDEMSDAHLLGLVASKDADAFSCLYDRLSPMLFSVAMSIVRDHAMAEDVTQDVFVLIWEKAGHYDPALGKPASWAAALARNKSLDKLRSSKRKDAAMLRLETMPIEEYQQDVQTEVVSSETGAILKSAMQNLPVDQRRAIELAFLQGLTHAEIAEKLGQPLGTIKARIRRGMLELKDLLNDTNHLHNNDQQP